MSSDAPNVLDKACTTAAIINCRQIVTLFTFILMQFSNLYFIIIYTGNCLSYTHMQEIVLAESDISDLLRNMNVDSVYE